MQKMMQLKLAISIISKIRIGSKWELKSNSERVTYTNVAHITLGPHQSITVTALTITDTDVLVSIVSREGDVYSFSHIKFLDKFREIRYPTAYLKDFFDEDVLFVELKNEYNINLKPYFNKSTRMLQINDVTFDVIVNVLEKQNKVKQIITKREKNYNTYAKATEKKTYGL